MPIWSEILGELAKSKPPDFDGVRRKYLFQMRKHTGRPVILYASTWLQKESPPFVTIIGDEDIHALMEVTNGLRGKKLDLILHSPGGSPTAVEAIVTYLRSRFDHIRVIVPQLAMSAATMLACAANEILMGKHSFLGPTDPQIVLSTPLGMRSVPAQATLDQFSRAQRECTDPTKLAAWLPMLTQYGPDLLVQCESALELSRELVRKWLETYMFKDLEDKDRKKKSSDISSWLANHKLFKSHGRHLSRANLIEQGLVIRSLESDEKLQDLSLSVFHATAHTFSATPAVKIVENHAGRAFIKNYVQQQIKVAPGPSKP